MIQMIYSLWQLIKWIMNENNPSNDAISKLTNISYILRKLFIFFVIDKCI